MRLHHPTRISTVWKSCRHQFRFLSMVLVSLVLMPCWSDHCYGQATNALIYEGFTEAEQDIMVSASELGMLTRVHVQMGDRVQAGQVLAELDDSQQRAVVRISRAQSQMTGDLDLAVAEERMYRDKTETLREMLADGLARPDEFERSETSWLMAQARVTQAREQQQLRRLQLQRDELQLARRRIVAPMDGVIARVLHQRGEYLTPADSNVFEMLGDRSLDAVFNISVEDLVHIQIGMPVRVFLRSRSETVEAEISQVSPSIDGRSATVQIRVRIENPDGEYLHGDRCTLRLVPGAQRRPSSALKRDEPVTPLAPALPRPSAPSISMQKTVEGRANPNPTVFGQLPETNEPPATGKATLADLLRSAGTVSAPDKRLSLKDSVPNLLLLNSAQAPQVAESSQQESASGSILRSWLQERTRSEGRSR